MRNIFLVESSQTLYRRLFSRNVLVISRLVKKFTTRNYPVSQKQGHPTLANNFVKC